MINEILCESPTSAVLTSFRSSSLHHTQIKLRYYKLNMLIVSTDEWTDTRGFNLYTCMQTLSLH